MFIMNLFELASFINMGAKLIKVDRQIVAVLFLLVPILVIIYYSFDTIMARKYWLLI